MCSPRASETAREADDEDEDRRDREREHFCVAFHYSVMHSLAAPRAVKITRRAEFGECSQLKCGTADAENRETALAFLIRTIPGAVMRRLQRETNPRTATTTSLQRRITASLFAPHRALR